MFEGDLAFDVFGQKLNFLVFLVGKFFFAQKFEYALARSRRALHAGKRLRKLRKRRSEQSDVQRERYHDAETHALGNEHRADDAHRHVTQISDKVHERHHQSRKKLRFPRTRIKVAVDGIELGLDLFFGVVRLDDVVPRIDFLHVPVEIAEIPLLAHEVFLRFAHDEKHEHESDQARDDGGDRHDRVGHEHHDDAADEHDDGGKHGHERLIQRLTDGIHVVGNAGEHVAHAVGIEIFEGQQVDFFGDRAAQPLRVFLRDRRHDDALQVRAEQSHRIDDDEEDTYGSDFLQVHIAQNPL